MQKQNEDISFNAINCYKVICRYKKKETQRIEVYTKREGGGKERGEGGKRGENGVTILSNFSHHIIIFETLYKLILSVNLIFYKMFCTRIKSRQIKVDIVFVKQNILTQIVKF